MGGGVDNPPPKKKKEGRVMKLKNWREVKPVQSLLSETKTSSPVYINLYDKWIAIGVLSSILIVVVVMIIFLNPFLIGWPLLLIPVLASVILGLIFFPAIPIDKGFRYAVWRWGAFLGLVNVEEGIHIVPLVNKVVKIPEFFWVDVSELLVKDGITTIIMQVRILFRTNFSLLERKIWKLPDAIKGELSGKLGHVVLGQWSMTNLEKSYQTLKNSTSDIRRWISEFLKKEYGEVGYVPLEVIPSFFEDQAIGEKPRSSLKEKAPYENWFIILIPLLALCSWVFNPNDPWVFLFSLAGSSLIVNWLHFFVGISDMVVIDNHVIKPGNYLKLPWQKIEYYGWKEIPGKDNLRVKIRPIRAYLTDALVKGKGLIEPVKGCSTLEEVRKLELARYFQIEEVLAPKKTRRSA